MQPPTSLSSLSLPSFSYWSFACESLPSPPALLAASNPLLIASSSSLTIGRRSSAGQRKDIMKRLNKTAAPEAFSKWLAEHKANHPGLDLESPVWCVPLSLTMPAESRC